MKRFFDVAVYIILFGLAAFFILSFVFPGNKLIIEKKSDSLAVLGGYLEKKEEEASKVVFFAVGDIMLDRGVEYRINREGKGDFKFPFFKIADYLRKADILFGNLESLISDKGRKVGSVNSFRAEPGAMEGLLFSGFDIVSVANNHFLDYTGEAMRDCFQRLKEAGVEYIGGGFNEKEAFALKVKEVKNTKIGFLAYTNLGPQAWRAGKETIGISWTNKEDLENIKSNIREAKAGLGADILVVSFHWGDEYTPNPNYFQTSFAKALIDEGADLIIGHHPHVVQPVEKYKDGWIAYSLGNFVFDMGFSEETMEGLLLEVIIKDKEIKEVIPRKIKISDSFQPYLSD